MGETEWHRNWIIVQGLQKLLVQLKRTKRKAVGTRNFVRVLSDWNNGEQEDATEFAKYLLNVIWETVLHSKSKNTYGGRAETDQRYQACDPYFGGVMKSQTTCSKCQSITRPKRESFYALGLAFNANHGHDEQKDNNNRLLSMVREHFEPEVLKGRELC